MVSLGQRPGGKPRGAALAVLTLLAVAPVFGAGVPGPAAPPAAPPRAVTVPADHAQKMERGTVLFAERVRPVLLAQCVKCHGGARKMGGFDLTTREALLKPNAGRVAVVPGNAKASRMLRLTAHQEAPHMPLQAPKLSAAQLSDLATWIDLGAPYDRPLLSQAGPKLPMVVTDDDRKYWAFRPLASVAPPQPRNGSWCRTPIDRFIQAKLEEKGLRANPLADRRTLIRRAYFDLIGLPPTPEEVDAFLKDPAPDAYPRLLDRLLANPHYGERWGRHWLDLARFAESHGFEHDYDRPNAYHYRDFVIRALNQDLPYTTFVKWQLAGDEYEPENPLALAATGFLAAGVHSTQITQSQVEKERYDELDDMARTTGTAMLGLTVGCARCHDHKYDPIPTKDYYRLAATFTTTVRSDFDVPDNSEQVQAARKAWTAEHAALQSAVEQYDRREVSTRLDQWLASRGKSATVSGPSLSGWVLPESLAVQSRGSTLTQLDDGSLRATGTNPDHDQYTFTLRTHLTGITALRLEALSDPSLVRGGPGRAPNGNFALSDLKVTAAPLAGGAAVPVKFARARATFEQAGLAVRGLIDDDLNTAWAVDPQFGKDHAAVLEAAAPFGFDGGTVLTVTLQFNNNTQHSIGRPRLSLLSGDVPTELQSAPAPEGVVRALATLDRTPSARLPEAERAALLRWFGAGDPARQALVKQVEAHQAKYPSGTMKMLICSEGVPALRLHTQGGDFLEQTYFLKRGDPHQKDGVATPGFLSVLNRAPDGEQHWAATPPPGWRTSYRRRALAEWITDPNAGAGHLLARVIVNRMWQHHLGRGIVGTPSDFGIQGERPTHPELLDWLAGELIRSGWKLKTLHKLIMTSAVYMQGDAADPARTKLDPDNRLCWRRTPQRLEAEVIRDSLLSVSGALDERMFGPGTLEPDMTRRSIYFMVKRSRLIPMMVLFDAPDALQGSDRRVTTTIAPQALLLMNNPAVRSYAEKLAARVEPPGAPSTAGALNALYMRTLSRPPTAKEATEGAQFLKQQEAAYTGEAKPNPRMHALADLAQVLFCLNEFVYVD